MPSPGQRRLARLLRVLAVLDLLALAAVLMPAAWMSSTHVWLGLGELHAGPMTTYLARTASLLYAFQGATFWHLAGDVCRYRPLIAFWGRLTLPASLVFLAIDRTAGLPLWWSIVECLCVAAIGASLLVGVRWLDDESALGNDQACDLSLPDRANIGV